MFNKFFNQLLTFLKNYFVFIALALIFLASSYSIFHKGFFHLHDFTHAARIAEMARAIDEGQFPVRWSENFGYGFGMPLFNFYAPLPYFIGAIFFKLGFDVITSIKLLYLLVNLLTLSGAYLLGKKLLGRSGGLLLAAAYTLAPYRAVNLFVRGALSEAFAMTFLPFVLFAIIAFTKKQDKKYLLILVISLFSIILSHNLTALIFVPMAAIFTFAYLIYLKKIKLLWIIAAQFLLALLLSAFYVLPAVLEKDLTIINIIFSGYFHYSNHFLYIRQFFEQEWKYGGSAWGPNDGISFYLGRGQLLGLAFLIISTSSVFVKNFKKTFKSKLFFLIISFAILLLISLFMSILKSQVIWDKLTILQYIQFPWRFLSAASVFVAVLLALSAYLISKKVWRSIYVFGLLLLLLGNAFYFKPEKYLEDPSALYYSDAKKIQNQMSETLPDYIPKQMAEKKVLLAANQNLPLSWVETDPKNNHLEIMFDHGFEKMVFADFKSDELLNFKIAYFPGWEVEIDGEKQAIQFNSELGNLQVAVPRGGHKVAVFFGENTTARKIGDICSVLALIITFYFFYPFATSKRKS